jgi:7,8-dihydropterin-6-yl-methyl-4-(beta-D-ribofuranosyl)aminobenzene 5'-phosphate synthase
MLTRVDKLEFLVLVDNSIERLQKLPPGFIHELPQHIHAPNAEVDSLTGLPLMRLANFCCGAHGLSILLVCDLPCVMTVYLSLTADYHDWRQVVQGAL